MKKIRGRIRTIITICLLVALCVGVLPMQGSVSADTTKSYQDEIDAAKKKKEELENNLNTYMQLNEEVKSKVTTPKEVLKNKLQNLKQ